MHAFRVAIAISNAESEHERRQLAEILAIAREVDDQESGLNEALFASRRQNGFAALAVPTPLPPALEETLKTMRDADAALTRHHKALEPTAILGMIKDDLLRAIAFWRGLVGPAESADRPVIDAMNAQRERLIAAIDASRFDASGAAEPA